MYDAEGANKQKCIQFIYFSDISEFEYIFSGYFKSRFIFVSIKLVEYHI